MQPGGSPTSQQSRRVSNGVGLLFLSAATAVTVLWRARAVLAFPALYAAGVMAVLATAEGNFGTLYRHRGEMVWPLALLGVAGVHELWMQRSVRVGSGA